MNNPFIPPNGLIWLATNNKKTEHHDDEDGIMGVVVPIVIGWVFILVSLFIYWLIF